jgi:hypothetical protein
MSNIIAATFGYPENKNSRYPEILFSGLTKTIGR